jgi:hypothetical protein
VFADCQLAQEEGKMKDETRKRNDSLTTTLWLPQSGHLPFPLTPGIILQRNQGGNSALAASANARASKQESTARFSLRTNP